jgi:hypothetical protein
VKLERITRSVRSFQSFTVTFRGRCVGQPAGTFSPPVTQMRVHYRYLHVFARSQEIPIVAPLVLSC